MFYWFTSIIHLMLPMCIIAALIEARFKKGRYILLYAVIVTPLMMVGAIPYADWRKELALSSLFKDNLRYASSDYDRAVIDRVNVVSLHVMQLEDFFQEGYDACVEAYVNLPNSLGGMAGFDWVYQVFEYDDERFSVFFDMLSFHHKDFWSYSEIDYGRCVAPNPSSQNFFGFYSH